MDEKKETKLMEDEVVQEDHEVKKEKKIKHKEQVDKLEKEIYDLKDKLLRNAAELENFKKRVHTERIQERKFASKNLIADILNPLDQMNKVVNMPTEDPMLKNFLIGFKMINDSLYNVLISDGLKEIDALNQPFNPNFHYAIEKVSNKEKPNGINLEVIQKGYTYKEQLLRPAMVKINEWSEEENGKDE